MVKKSTLILFSVIFLLQVPASGNGLDPKYGEGAVPKVEGKVVFSRNLSSGMASGELFALMDEWLKNEYKDGSKGRVILSNAVNGELAALGEQEIVFRLGTLSVDKTNMIYQLLLEVEGSNCKMTLRNIKYRYDDVGKEKIFQAEELITDELALNKNKTKLNRYYDKFRTRTIDYVDELFNSAESFLAQKSPVNTANAAAVQPRQSTSPLPAVVSPAATGTESPDMPGYRRVDAGKIPGNIVKLLGEWTLITSGKDKVNTMTASWGGLGVLWEQPVSFCFINPSRHSINTMDEGDTYTVSFYTEAYKDALRYCGTHSGKDEDKIINSGLTPIKTPSGAAAFSEAWMIIECRKIIAQPISADGIMDKETSAKWSKNGYHKMYVGKILNVWIK